jgi:hypothetical protein
MSVYNNIQGNAVPSLLVPSLLVPSLPYMVVHMTAEGAVVSRRPVQMCPTHVQSSRGKSRGGSGMSTTIGVDKLTMGVEEGIGRQEGRSGNGRMSPYITPPFKGAAS